MRLKGRQSNRLYSDVFQRGSGYPIFRGRPGTPRRLDGGGFFGTLFKKVVPRLGKKVLKKAIPLTKKIAKQVGPAVMEVASKNIDDVLAGKKSIKQAAKAMGKEGRAELIKETKSAMRTAMKGGGGRVRRGRRKLKTMSRHKTHKGDIFDMLKK